MESKLFTPLKLRDVTFPNRIGMSPMCQYSAINGFVDEWHLVHYGARATGRAGVIIMEAAAIRPDGRITTQDLGLWDDAHVKELARVAEFIREQDVVPGIQLAHAGRKASTLQPWHGGNYATPDLGGWLPIWSASTLPFDTNSATPQALSQAQIATFVAEFAAAAERAAQAGMQVVELHAAHGYLLHQFLSPLTNRREDEYGGSFENRTRFTREAVVAVRRAWPQHLPLFVRLSATDWVPGGWDLEQSVELARWLKALGVDLVDCSSGGLVPDAQIPVAPGFQVPFAAEIRRSAAIATAAVGLITEVAQAERIIAEESADLILMGRQLLRDPLWPHRAARELQANHPHPVQYARAIPQ